MAVPANPLDLEPEWLTQALRNSGILGEASVTGYSVETITEGQGFMNQLFRLSPQYDRVSADLPDTVIVKLPSADPVLRTVFSRLRQNRREVRFYQKLAGNEHLPGPGCYYAGVDATTGLTVLALEDMSRARQGDSVAGCSVDEAARAMVHLGRFQASWWNSSRLESLEWMPLKDAESNAYLEIYPGAWESLIGKAGVGMPEGLRGVGNRLRREIPRVKAKLTRPPRTILHGDFRLDNCFFVDDIGSRPPVVFDWEFCVRGRGVCDVATFVSEAFPPPQRRDVELALVRTYHSELMENGVNGYGLEECWHDYRLAMLEVFVFWIVTGGYCDFQGERATRYLHNTLSRLDAAISDLASVELVSG